jgi:transposase
LPMHVVHTHCCGLDVHKQTVVACVLIVDPDGEVLKQTKSFGTMTADLLALGDWLVSLKVSHAAMESTGVYWKPIFHLLEGRVELMLVNAQHIKRVPGRKTDVKDAQWIAELLQHGLLKASFVPPPQVRELRDLTRQRAILIRERATVINRVQKVLEDANIKLASVASDSLGVSGRAMIEALIGGKEDPEELANLAKKRLRNKIPELRKAMQGRVTDHHRFQLKMLLRQLDQEEALIAEYDQRIAKAMVPFEEAAARLKTIPGVSQKSAEVIVAEIGTDMTRFATSGHLASWAGLCPGNNQSGGKRFSGRTTRGNQWLRTMLVQVAWAAVHAKKTIFRERYSRLSKRIGKKKALVAIGHKILSLIHLLLKQGMDYREVSVSPQAA